MNGISLDRLQLALHERRAGGRVQRCALAVARYALALLRDLWQGEVSLRAMSLVYTTLLSFIPLLALGFSLLKALGVHHGLQAMLGNFLQPLGPDAGMLANRLVEFVDNVKVGVLGSVGVGLLLYSAVSLIYKVEASFNFLWEINGRARRAQRFGEYVAVLVVGPAVVFSAMGMTASLRSPEVVGEILQIEPFGSLLVLLSKLLPYLLMVAVFVFIYSFLPNLRVRWKAAMIGGVFAGFVWQTASITFATFVARASNYNAVYSSFAILIFLLIWMYVGWLIMLLGCRLSFYVQFPERLLPHPPPTYGSREGEGLALAAFAEVARDYIAGRTTPTLAELAHRLGATPDGLERAMAPLRADGLLVEAADGGRLLPARDLDSVDMGDVWLSARGARLAPTARLEPVNAYLARLEATVTAEPVSVRAWLAQDEARRHMPH